MVVVTACFGGFGFFFFLGLPANDSFGLVALEPLGEFADPRFLGEAAGLIVVEDMSGETPINNNWTLSNVSKNQMTNILLFVRWR
jgi:hypothetical protein